ncbi:hypothetical protein [Planctobacterium marinum]|uniref:hypothetical protein n=1 Tax=Planctobacterium marinum TaxID=1631968 RepID=UPI001E52D60E|nr:hypothetical protein [Planctobacterium marinum]MCC2607781.1 hypothetical protein [Planctobacterium marinum]
MSKQKNTSHAQHYVVGYGSLMSHDSRFRYSQIDADAIPVQVRGWQRAWNMCCPDNSYTCVGVIPGTETQAVNGMLVPVAEITPQLRQREQSYHFVQIDQQQLQYHGVAAQNDIMASLNDAVIWICQVSEPAAASQSHPIYQTYVDTCLSGCLEHVSEEFAFEFIEKTLGWAEHWVNDRHAPRYPRLANIDLEMQHRIDGLLQSAGILALRKEG